ncbi:hypothetical protein Nepgr_017470 [Nepenthes gracilis]|uniref:Uncharacterized protein n=1 Tax=Nepenthes gracilis TaxID=150966 RepID=A0AAD3XT44_NEPGR|nr:hypothetical protein Nepgr_017470 [Nepenthes gracilis]
MSAWVRHFCFCTDASSFLAGADLSGLSSSCYPIISLPVVLKRLADEKQLLPVVGLLSPPGCLFPGEALLLMCRRSCVLKEQLWLDCGSGADMKPDDADSLAYPRSSAVLFDNVGRLVHTAVAPKMLLWLGPCTGNCLKRWEAWHLTLFTMRENLVHSKLPLECSSPDVAGGRLLEVLGAVKFGNPSAALALNLDWSSSPALALNFGQAENAAAASEALNPQNQPVALPRQQLHTSANSIYPTKHQQVKDHLKAASAGVIKYQLELTTP